MTEPKNRYEFIHMPIPGSVVVRASKCGRPFGFAQHSGVDWKPEGAERRTRDAETVEWAKSIREKGEERE